MVQRQDIHEAIYEYIAKQMNCKKLDLKQGG